MARYTEQANEVRRCAFHNQPMPTMQVNPAKRNMPATIIAGVANPKARRPVTHSGARRNNPMRSLLTVSP